MCAQTGPTNTSPAHQSSASSATSFSSWGCAVCSWVRSGPSLAHALTSTTNNCGTDSHAPGRSTSLLRSISNRNLLQHQGQREIVSSRRVSPASTAVISLFCSCAGCTTPLRGGRPPPPARSSMLCRSQSPVCFRPRAVRPLPRCCRLLLWTQRPLLLPAEASCRRRLRHSGPASRRSTQRCSRRPHVCRVVLLGHRASSSLASTSARSLRSHSSPPAASLRCAGAAGRSRPLLSPHPRPGPWCPLPGVRRGTGESGFRAPFAAATRPRQVWRGLCRLGSGASSLVANSNAKGRHQGVAVGRNAGRAAPRPRPPAPSALSPAHHRSRVANSGSRLGAAPGTRAMRPRPFSGHPARKLAGRPARRSSSPGPPSSRWACVRCRAGRIKKKNRRRAMCSSTHRADGARPETLHSLSTLTDEHSSNAIIASLLQPPRPSLPRARRFCAHSTSRHCQSSRTSRSMCSPKPRSNKQARDNQPTPRVSRPHGCSRTWPNKSAASIAALTMPSGKRK